MSDSPGTQNYRFATATDSVRCLTIAQARNIEEKFGTTHKAYSLDGYALSKVKLVAQVIGLEKYPNRWEYLLDDGSGQMKLKVWKNPKDDFVKTILDLSDDELEKCPYVVAMGILNKYQRSVSMHAEVVLRPEKDYLAVYLHSLQAIYEHIAVLKAMREPELEPVIVQEDEAFPQDVEETPVIPSPTRMPSPPLSPTTPLRVSAPPIAHPVVVSPVEEQHLESPKATTLPPTPKATPSRARVKRKPSKLSEPTVMIDLTLDSENEASEDMMANDDDPSSLLFSTPTPRRRRYPSPPTISTPSSKTPKKAISSPTPVASTSRGSKLKARKRLDPYATLSNTERDIMIFLAEEEGSKSTIYPSINLEEEEVSVVSESSNVGISRTYILNTLARLQYTPSEIKEALGELLRQGFIHDTVDKEHFAVTK